MYIISLQFAAAFKDKIMVCWNQTSTPVLINVNNQSVYLVTQERQLKTAGYNFSADFLLWLFSLCLAVKSFIHWAVKITINMKRLQTAKCRFTVIQTIWHLTGISAAVLAKRLSKYKRIRSNKIMLISNHATSRLREIQENPSENAVEANQACICIM